jgi:pantoate--beta-alanine ligase
MAEAVAAMKSGTPIDAAMTALAERLAAAGFAGVDYAEVRDAESLRPLEAVGRTQGRLLVAARIGRARLIDNVAV